MAKITDFNLVFEPNINNVNIKDIEVNIYKNIHYISIRVKKTGKKFIYCENYVRNHYKFADDMDYSRIKHIDDITNGKHKQVRVYFKENYYNLYQMKYNVYYDIMLCRG